MVPVVWDWPVRTEGLASPERPASNLRKFARRKLTVPAMFNPHLNNYFGGGANLELNYFFGKGGSNIVARGGSEVRPGPGSGPGSDRGKTQILGPGPVLGFSQKNGIKRYLRGNKIIRAHQKFSLAMGYIRCKIWLHLVRYDMRNHHLHKEIGACS